MLNKAHSVPAIMVSYRRDDSEAITGRIFDRLTSSFGKDAVFRDIDNIPVGVDFREYISGVLVQTDVLVVVIGRRWLGRSRAGTTRIENELDLVRIEVETALQQQLPVIPVLVGNAQMPSVAELPDSIKPLASRNAIRVDAGQDFENHIGRLIRGISGNLSEGTTHHLQRKLAKSSRTWRVGLSVVFVALIFGGTLVYHAYRNVEHAPESPHISKSDQSSKTPHIEAATQSGELKDWTLFGYTKSEIPYYIKFESIRAVGQTRFSAWERSSIDTSLPMRIKDIPAGAYQEDLEVYDCLSSRVWTSEEGYYSKSRELLYHYKWADPEFVEGTADPVQLAAGSVGATARAIVCNAQLRKPLVTKQQLQEMKFPSLSTTPAGDGDLYYKLVDDSSTSSDSHQVLIISHFNMDKNFLENSGVPKIDELIDVKYRFIVTLAQMGCAENKITTIKTEYYTPDYDFFNILLPDSAHDVSNFIEKSPLGLLQRMICNSKAPD